MSGLEQWRPGSFTKNFGWGPKENGLRLLYDVIVAGFDARLENTLRSTFLDRIRGEFGPAYIPLNFFLCNRVVDGESYVIADELVFQALNFPHGEDFDKLALFCLNFSYVGLWKGAKPWQARPALWAFHYISDRLNGELNWHVARVSADDIERFIVNDKRYVGQQARKLATNLNYLYEIGHLSQMSSGRVERWWVDAHFLALDRIINDRHVRGVMLRKGQYYAALTRSGFLSVAGRESLDKALAAGHLINLYQECGASERFSDENVRQLMSTRISEVASAVEENYIPNDRTPVGAVHPTSTRILKGIPRICSMLARYAGFTVVEFDELQNFDARDFVRKHTKEALKKLKREHVSPTMSAAELIRMTRGHG